MEGEGEEGREAEAEEAETEEIVVAEGVWIDEVEVAKAAESLGDEPEDGEVAGEGVVATAVSPWEVETESLVDCWRPAAARCSSSSRDGGTRRGTAGRVW